MTKLVIVESPAKCSKIQEYLGPGYKVMSSMGHIRALKADLESVGINRDWTPTYENMPTKAKTIKDLKEASSNADEVILATDDDREGEGIAYHICAVLKLNPLTTKRIIFHSITKKEIQEAASKPTLIDINKFHSQQTRAMLDMMIGYTLSPVLWKQLNSNGLALSAGRCQTPALKLVLDRDKEIENHASKRFWAISATFALNGMKVSQAIEASLSDKPESDKQATEYLQQATKACESILKSSKQSIRTHGAPKPLITSTLQQEASKSFGLNPKATMAAAQKLYEGGHITYMRTDNAFLSPEGAADCRKEISKRCGEKYLGPVGQHQGVVPVEEDAKANEVAKTAKSVKSKKKGEEEKPQAQAAHEAIRPTHAETDTVTGLGTMEEKVYRLIWQRALQSQMATATEDALALTFTINCDKEAKPWYGEIVKNNFIGWKLLNSTEKTEEKQKNYEELWQTWSKLATVAAETAAKWLSVVAEEGFTKPKSRYTEASLIHDLEGNGIGRPSTFASLVTTIVDRNYVEKSDSPGIQIDIKKWLIKSPNQWPPLEQTHKQTTGKESNKLQVTPLGRTVAEFLYKHYDDLFAYSYTAKMEQELDHVAKGSLSWKTLLQKSWDLYKERYQNHLTEVLDPEAKKANKADKKRDLGEGICVVLSRKGPLLLKEETKDFASLPQGSSFETVTLKQALNAYAQKDGINFGSYEDEPLLKKKGPYGFYIQYKTLKVPCKADDTTESIIEKIKQKEKQSQEGAGAGPVASYERKVGDYTIKKGPYGLYFFKHTLKKATFVSFPTASDPEKVTAADMPALYDLGMNAKKYAKKKTPA